MEESQAMEILVKEIGNNFGGVIVREDIEKNELFNTSKIKYSVADPVIIEYSDGKYTYDNITKKNLKDLLTLPDGFENANYYFLDVNLTFKEEQVKGMKIHFWVTPYAVIGDKEKEIFKKSYYKESDYEVCQAMDVLKIKNFCKIYQVYKKYSEKYLPKHSKEIIDFINLVENIHFDHYGETPSRTFNKLGGKTNLNKMFRELGISTRINGPIKSSSHFGYVKKEGLYKLVNELKVNKKTLPFHDFPQKHIEDFLNLVFKDMPYEDGNSAANKTLFNMYQSKLDYIGILTKEYCGGDYFEDYFSCLTKDKQKKFMEHLKGTNYSNPYLNKFLRSKGFKELAIDPIALYKNGKANKFIDYFKGRPAKEKEEIMKKLYDCDSMDDEVIQWLNKHEPKLVRRVGLKS